MDGVEISREYYAKEEIVWEMNKERPPSIVHNWMPAAKRPVERQKQWWMGNALFDKRGFDIFAYVADIITTGRNRVRPEELIEDRERRKDVTAASMAGQPNR